VKKENNKNLITKDNLDDFIKDLGVNENETSKENILTENEIDELLISFSKDSKEYDNYNDIWQPTINSYGDIFSEIKMININSKMIDFNLTLINKSKSSTYFIPPIFFEEFFVVKEINNSIIYRWGIPALISMSHENDPGIVFTKNEIKNFKISLNIKNILDESFEGYISIPEGNFEAYFIYKVDNNYFCPYTHTNYQDIIEESNKKNINLWTGLSISNIVKFNFSKK